MFSPVNHLEAGPAGFAGGLTQRKYAAMTGISSATAFRDIEHLLQLGMLARGGAGRATYYDLSIAGWEWLPKR
jgi:Fic family protein